MIRNTKLTLYICLSILSNVMGLTVCVNKRLLANAAVYIIKSTDLFTTLTVSAPRLPLLFSPLPRAVLLQ